MRAVKIKGKRSRSLNVVLSYLGVQPWIQTSLLGLFSKTHLTTTHIRPSKLQHMQRILRILHYVDESGDSITEINEQNAYKSKNADRKVLKSTSKKEGEALYLAGKYRLKDIR